MNLSGIGYYITGLWSPGSWILEDVPRKVTWQFSLIEQHIIILSNFCVKIFFPVGGIYQVIRSKCSASVEELGDQYCLLGPYKETSVRTEVELSEFSADSPLTVTINNLRREGWRVSSCLLYISYLVLPGDCFVIYCTVQL